MDVIAILSLNVEELKAKLTELNLSTMGVKAELQDRLIRHYHNNELNQARGSVNESLFVDAETVPIDTCRTMFTLRDVEDSVSHFSGVDTDDVNRWITEFEEVAQTVNWSPLHMFIYSKQLIKGAAKLYLRGLVNVKTWSELKVTLIQEFGKQKSAAEVHNLLRNRKKHLKESLIEYLYVLVEIGNSVEMDDLSIVEYFVEGIPASCFNKQVLYEARNLNELKEKIKIYEKMRGSQIVVTRNPTHTANVPTKQESKSIQKKCFRCGKENHLARDCTSDVLCFKCKVHYSYQCSKPGQDTKKERVNTIEVMNRELIFVDVTSERFKFRVLIDSGSHYCLMRHDTFKMLLPRRKLKIEKLHMQGVGGGSLTTMGSLNLKVQVGEISLNLDFHVVEEKDLPAILGLCILKFVEINIREGEIEIKERKEKIDENESPLAAVKGEDVEVKDESCGDEMNRSNFGLEIEDVKRGKSMLKSGSIDVSDEFKILCCIEPTNKNDELDVDVSHLKLDVARQIETLVKEYKPERPTESPVTMKIVVTDDVPVYQTPRRMSYADKVVVREQVSKWLEEGIIVHSSSEYASPVVLVSKKDGTKRLCCDYRALNMKIVRDNFPMTVIDEVLERLQDAKVFITLDLLNGFFHVPVDINSCKYTAFVCCEGQFEFKFVPFGISNSPAVFCRFFHSIFRGLLAEGIVVIYMDVIVIPAKDEDDGIHKLKKVLHVAEKNGLRIKWEKCQFLKSKINFLGYIIESGTILPSDEKTNAIRNFPIPKNKTELQRFLGLTSYFRRFVDSYAKIAKPLSDLLRQSVVFKIDDVQDLAIQQLKEALTKAPALKLYCPQAVTEIHTDASKYGYGAVLLQKDSIDGKFHPVEFMSRRTSSAEEKYSSYELEVLAIIRALQKWRVYVKDCKFTIVTDCNAFAMTVKRKDVPDRVIRWAMYLQEYNYVVEHRAGTRMRHVDALSRVYSLLVEDSLKHRLCEAQMQDGWLKAVRKVLDNLTYEDFFLKNGLIFKDETKELLVVPSSMEEEIIRIAHRQGHFGSKRTQEIVEKFYYIPQLSGKVHKVVRSCVDCIMTDAKAGKKEGLLIPIDKSDEPLGTLHLDHVGPLTQTRKLYNHILVVVDGFSKFVWLYPTKSTGVDEVLNRLTRQAEVFGNPKRMVTDRGAAFTSSAFKSYCVEQNIQHLLIATGVPRGNGQVERIHRIIIPMIAKFSHDRDEQWYRHVGRVQQILNSTAPRSTGRTPFRILTGLEMRRNDFPDMREYLDEVALNEVDIERNQIRLEAQSNIQKIQLENRKSFDKGRKPSLMYEIGQLVAIKKTQFGVCSKLRLRYLGPYKVTAKLPHGRYEIEKVGQQEGPIKTNSVAEYMKPWA